MAEQTESIFKFLKLHSSRTHLYGVYVRRSTAPQSGRLNASRRVFLGYVEREGYGFRAFTLSGGVDSEQTEHGYARTRKAAAALLPQHNG